MKIWRGWPGAADAEAEGQRALHTLRSSTSEQCTAVASLAKAATDGLEGVAGTPLVA